MKKILFATFLFSFSLVSSPIFFKPEKLTCQKSDWVHKATQRYFDYLYNGKVIFHVTEKMVPAIVSLIAYAVDNGGKLKLKDHTEIFFFSEMQIKSNFSVSFEQTDMIIVDPKTLVLTKEPGKSAGKVKYFAKFSADSEPLKIWAKAYRLLKLERIKAICQCQFLRINVDALDGIRAALPSEQKIVTLVPPLE